MEEEEAQFGNCCKQAGIHDQRSRQESYSKYWVQICTLLQDTEQGFNFSKSPLHILKSVDNNTDYTGLLRIPYESVCVCVKICTTPKMLVVPCEGCSGTSLPPEGALQPRLKPYKDAAIAGRQAGILQIRCGDKEARGHDSLPILSLGSRQLLASK